MARRKHATLPAPGGYSLQTPAALPPQRAALLRGFLPARLGKLLPAPAPQVCHSVDGMRFSAPLLYMGQYGTNKVIYVGSDGYLYSASIGLGAAYRGGENWVTCTVGTPGKPGLGYLGSQHAGPIRWWSAIYQNEMFFGDAISGGIRRYYIDSGGTERLYEAGLVADGVPSLSQGTTGSLTLLGTYTYYTVAVDEFGRESSPSATTAITLTGANDDVTVTRGSHASGGETGQSLWRVYRKNPNGSVFYRVSQSDIASGTTTFVDTASDVVAAAYEIGPLPGENDAPGAAKCGVIWKNRLVIRDGANPFRIKLSNYGRPTQFSSISSPSNAQLGGSIIITSTYGDEITALVDFGSVLGVFTRYAFFTVMGDDSSSWRVRQVHKIGCSAPGTVATTGGTCYWANSDGVYRMSGDLAPVKISEEIEADLLAWRVRPSVANGEASAPEAAASTYASAFWLDHRYYMDYVGKQWVYDELTGGWGRLEWGEGMAGAVGVAFGTAQSFAVMGINPALDRDAYWYPFAFFDYPYFFYLIGNDEAHSAWPHGLVDLGHLPVYTSRPFNPAGEPHASNARPEAYIAWGAYKGRSGSLEPIGRLTLVCDAMEETYDILPPDEEMVARGRLIEQEMTGLLSGEEVSVKLEFWERGIELREQRLEVTALS